MKNPLMLQFSSAETDRKIAWHASVIFMILAWALMASALTWLLVAFHADGEEWSEDVYAIVGAFLVPVVLIPIQLVHYFREKRGSR